MLECEYFTSGLCNACTWIDSAYSEQMILKIHATKELLHPVFRTATPDALWLPPVPSAQSRHKNKAIMTVSGTSEIPILGIMPDDDDDGVDITGCPQYPRAMEFVFAVVQNTIAAAEIQPYHAASGTGELKTVEVTISPANELMIRFVVRTGAALIPLRTYLSLLLKPLAHQRLPARVVAVHVEDEAAEYPLHGNYLQLQIDEIPLHVTTTSPFRTNQQVTAQLYRQARAWADSVGANSVWDLHCGVGGFGLAMARREVPPPRPRLVWGIDECQEAVRAANITAHEMGYRQTARFVSGNPARLDRYDDADIAVVTPPKSGGLGPLLEPLNATGPAHVIYGSARQVQMAEDLTKLNNYAPIAARIFDMYPNTPYVETAVLLERGSSPDSSVLSGIVLESNDDLPTL